MPAQHQLQHGKRAMDHRFGERHAVNATVFVRQRHWQGWRVAELGDLSVSGALLRLPGPSLRLHARVRLELRCPHGGKERLLHCGATVARIGPNLAGVAFDELAPAGFGPLFFGARRGDDPPVLTGPEAATRGPRRAPAA
jgi:hypothetical protein